MTATTEAENATTVYSVSDLNLAVRAILDEAFDTLWIKGEISNFSRPRSGHWYFTLKDAKSQIRVAMFRGANWQVGFQPEDGMEVFLYAKVSLYPERGDYQLIAEKMEVSGEGELQKAFERLKKKLAKEGLFKKEHKQLLPPYPRRIGVITSSTGAALKDILSVLERRYPILEIDVIPAMVQGSMAADTIVKAIKYANKLGNIDALILARGGGSLEDLWPFNEEKVAYAIFESQLPIISGVGHETDFTIADYVADVRAPTPSAAAETISPDGDDLYEVFNQYRITIVKKFLRELQYMAQKVDGLERRIKKPEKLLEDKKEELRSLLQRFKLAFKRHLDEADGALYECLTSIKVCLQQTDITRLRQHVSALLKQTHQISKTYLQGKEAKAKELVRTMHALSPLATLERGFSITSCDGESITNAKSLKKGDVIKTRLHKGVVVSKVETTES